MRKNISPTKTLLQTIKDQTRLLSLLYSLAFSVMVLLGVKSIYPVLDYLPRNSVLTMLAVLGCLVLAVLSITRIVSGKAVAGLNAFSLRLTYVLDACMAMQHEVHDDMLLRKAMESLFKLTGAVAGAVYLDRDGVLVRKTLGTGQEHPKTFALDQIGGIVGWVFQDGRVERVQRPDEDDRFDDRIDQFTECGPASALYIPIRIKDRTIGVIALAGAQHDTFIREDEELLSFLGNEAGAAIERAGQYEAQRNYEIHLTNILVTAMDNLLPEKRGHAQRVAHYALAVADQLGMPDGRRKRLYHAALLHDIGFLKMRFDEMMSIDDYKRHSQLAYDLLKPITVCSDLADIILYHHERYDGRGYPYGLRGNEIPLESRIIFVAEAFDAMVSKRSYKYIGKTAAPDDFTGVDCSAAVAELKRNAGSQFDPELTALFIKKLEEGAEECLAAFDTDAARPSSI